MKKGALAFITGTVLFFSGCEDPENLCGFSLDSLSFTSEYVRQLNAAVYLYQQADRALRDPTLLATGTSEIDGALCTRIQDSITIDFGNGVIGQDGKERKGSMRLSQTGSYMNPGSTVSLNLLDYSEAGITFTGMMSLANTPQGNTPAITLSIEGFSGFNTKLDGAIVAAWLSGFETGLQPEDDVFELSGELSLTSVDSSNVYRGLFNPPVRISNNCPFTFESGVISLSTTDIEGLTDVSVDFIDGDCMNLFQTNVVCDGNPIQLFYPIQ